MHDDGGTLYYPQKKCFLFWRCFYDHPWNKIPVCFDQLWKAEQFLDTRFRAKRYGSKIHQYKEPKY